jgi:prefoldin subunit 5
MIISFPHTIQNYIIILVKFCGKKGKVKRSGQVWYDNIRMRSLKLKISFILFFTICIFIFSTISDAAYKIHLKNGSVITGVKYYEKSHGEVKVFFEGGMIGIPEKDILKIEETTEPVKDVRSKEKTPEEIKEETKKDIQPEGVLPETEINERIASLRERIEEINKRISEIEKKEADLKNLQEEHQRTKLRTQVLYTGTPQDSGVVALEKRAKELSAKIAGTDDEEQKAALRAQLNAVKQQLTMKRSMLQQTMVEKRAEKAEIEKAEEELKPLLEEKNALIEERQKIEDEIRQLEERR